MRKNDFIRLIDANDFRELFITHLGWNRWRGNSRLLPIIVDDKEYQFQTVAERSGLQVVIAEVDELPNNSLMRKIDNQLRRQAQDYISIYVLRCEPKHQLWVVPLKNIDKRDLVSLEYIDGAHADFLFSKIADIEFNPGETTTIVDVKEAVHRAFFVNSEKITKDFYAGFKKQHVAFAKFITGIDDEIAIKDNRNKQWYASVMLNRLMFCYFIQKKGFLDGNPNYLRDKLNDCIAERGKNQFFSTFYLRFLRRLFSDGLNLPNHDRDFTLQFGRIPYLNGGMFDQHPIERDYADIDIEDEAFVSLFEFFDKWQWHLDTRVTASGKDINPDVLGYIFEQYINDRAQMGAYYTKEDITEYIGRNTILPFLFDRTSKSSKSVETMFAPDGWVWQTLRSSGDRYLFDAVKHGWTSDWRERIPHEITIGLDTSAPDLLSRRARWNDRTPEPFALPTEIWRETIERLQRVDSIMAKISAGEITSINDFITYNLDIRLFASDLIAQSDSSLFVYNFYDALRSVTILDPTCGSGAFLFAAMNILEPLYYECIMRLDEFKDNPKVKIALDEITSKYRSNIHYFIYKSIILRNLYGVDIMVEATEIAKLRLFLKMVAVVDVDYRADNLGLDPLPDIDFNIRCGNTLVGYANLKDINDDLKMATDILKELANQKFRERIEAEMDIVARTYKIFKQAQLTQTEDISQFKQAKRDLNARLKTLNDTLNHHLHNATAQGIPYDKWLKSHQPFNWVAEFYDIINGNGGFDVIIGNPPYVEYKDVKYQIYSDKKFSNLYAYCTNRIFYISNDYSRNSFIVPMSLSSIRNYENLRCSIQFQYKYIYCTNHAIRPTSLFNGISQRVSILFLIGHGEKCQDIFTTKYLRSYNHCILFQSINFIKTFADNSRDGIYPKINSFIQQSVLDKINRYKKDVLTTLSKDGSLLYYKDYGESYWIFPFSFEPWITPVKSYKTLCFNNAYIDKVFTLLNSSLFYLFYISYSDCWHFGKWHIEQFPISISTYSEVRSNSLKQSFETNRIIRYDKRANGNIYEYRIKYSKPIIDEIDKVLAKHYGFTEEELDFIINYDIKYRMGDELNNESDE